MADLITPANLSHLHLLINHFPTVGLVIAFLLLVVSIVTDSAAMKDDTMKPTALGVLFGIAVMTLPVFTTGLAAEGAIEKLPGISRQAMTAHEDSALLAFIVLELAGIAAWLGLWRWRRTHRVPPGLTFTTFVLAALSLGLMTVAANIGGAIRHPEILGDPRAEVARSMFSVSSAGVAFFVNGPGHQWVWPALESAHFVGMTLWFGVLLLANLRLMGWFTAIPYPALHRLLPWALLGFGVNEVSGMMFYLATPKGYTTNVVFYWKLLFLLLAAADLLYLTVWPAAWKTQTGTVTHVRERAIGAVALVTFVAVMYCGRMLPFLGNSF
jgi:uncharacterized membrane protein YidH (DUF202 family)